MNRQDAKSAKFFSLKKIFLAVLASWRFPIFLGDLGVLAVQNFSWRFGGS
ncbi:MAG: hypothetical protein KKA36_03805 [Gammaproteobacteria bacterium]|nr:hypothetical protein [Gammaproteobacteria bacterium]MBU2478191.1 hypothetical protein [Gammaproteobacteria bacterium]